MHDLLSVAFPTRGWKLYLLMSGQAGMAGESSSARARGRRASVRERDASWQGEYQATQAITPMVVSGRTHEVVN
jgi:hypothetical protein